MTTEKKKKKSPAKKAKGPSALDVYNRHVELFLKRRELISKRSNLSQKDQIEFDSICDKRNCVLPGNPPA